MGIQDLIQSGIAAGLEPIQKWRSARDARAARAVAKEVRQLRKVLELAVDTYREIHGLPPAYAGLTGSPAAPAELDSAGKPPGKILRQGDYQLVWFLEELAKENRIPISPATDLEALGVDMGWISPEGQLLVLPASAAGMEIEQGWLPR